MKLIRILFLVLFLSSSLVGAFAQTQIRGRITDPGHTPLIGATVSLLSKDSVYLAGTATDETGNFRLSTRRAQVASVRFSCIGYRTIYRPIVARQGNADMGTVVLSPASHELAGATVTAKAVVNEADKQIIIPTAEQIKVSTNATNLIRNLQIPRLSVDPLKNAITLAGNGVVQLRIDGREVTQAEVNALKPKDIQRIEYIDNPGMKYHGSDAVVNFVMKKRLSGGMIAMDTRNFLYRIKANENNLNAKYNYKASQFQFIVNSYVMKVDWMRNNTEQYNYPDHVYLKEEMAKKTRFNEKNYNLILNYNLLKQDKYMFNVALKDHIKDTPNSFEDVNATVKVSGVTAPYDISQLTKNRVNAPSLDAYFEYDLAHKQTLTLDAVGTYMNTRNTRTYQEFRGSDVFTNIYSHIAGRKLSLIGEAIYEKDFKTSQLTAGVRHQQAHANNTYTGNTSANVSLTDAQSYAYAEYQIKYKKFAYRAGLGVMRLYDKQDDVQNATYIFRPSLDVDYKPSDRWHFHYNAYISGQSPSLADMNGVDQLLDSLRTYRGNPALKPYKYYMNSLIADFSSRFVDVNVYASYRYDDHPVMEEVFFQNNRFITTNYNQRSFQKIYVDPTIKIKPFKQYISLSFSPDFIGYRSTGLNYDHTFNVFAPRVSLMANYKRWSFYAEAHWPQSEMHDEIIYSAEKAHLIMVGYNRKKWQISLMAFNLFSKHYTQYVKNLSTLTPSYEHMSSNQMNKLLMLNFSWNLDFGRSVTSKHKKINNSDSDSGILTGTER